MVAVLIEGEVGVDRECGSAGTMLERQLCLQRTCAGSSYGEDALSTLPFLRCSTKCNRIVSQMLELVM